jgi:hypothetical protein
MEKFNLNLQLNEEELLILSSLMLGLVIAEKNDPSEPLGTLINKLEKEIFLKANDEIKGKIVSLKIAATDSFNDSSNLIITQNIENSIHDLRQDIADRINKNDNDINELIK